MHNLRHYLPQQLRIPENIVDRHLNHSRFLALCFPYLFQQYEHNFQRRWLMVGLVPNHDNEMVFHHAIDIHLLGLSQINQSIDVLIGHHNWQMFRKSIDFLGHRQQWSKSHRVLLQLVLNQTKNLH